MLCVAGTTTPNRQPTRPDRRRPDSPPHYGISSRSSMLPPESSMTCLTVGCGSHHMDCLCLSAQRSFRKGDRTTSPEIESGSSATDSPSVRVPIAREPPPGCQGKTLARRRRRGHGGSCQNRPEPDPATPSGHPGIRSWRPPCIQRRIDCVKAILPIAGRHVIVKISRHILSSCIVQEREPELLRSLLDREAAPAAARLHPDPDQPFVVDLVAHGVSVGDDPVVQPLLVAVP